MRYVVCNVTHASQESTSYAATLSTGERRLAGRLESFGDIVFGFAVSQCAVQLPTTHGHVSVADPFALVLYFATFAILVSLWLTYHRIMSGSYRPTGLDLALPFVYLGFVSLVPYAMYAMSHGLRTEAVARDALTGYFTIYAVMTGVAIVLMVRNLRRGYFIIDDADRDRAWANLVRQIALCTIMLFALAADRTIGPTWAGITTMLIFPAMQLCRRRFRRAPSADVLRLRPRS